ncbi:hypothetical protein BKK79_16990 [Cupriavidus sp. USMAA2-4]|uniref:Uncharacterized protein n=1 Tax=Cupriavidus malaysiensis TaxID=367825 RepID=A0ABN4TS34_9BURK|nr:MULTISPECIES: DUF2968 domain-containing protein [Cupriavidus]AOY93310.1 hypothetical protein BKK79_16990 [Cupriavidus sp. USMAA2-4]AOZ00398.1 hypothetical protein BKK81_15010 [Cupriavidus sp. USMAHM13]AOZ07144.1 hypothetical protein BKK80_15960 [Cupriavidus malaysiensis]
MYDSLCRTRLLAGIVAIQLSLFGSAAIAKGAAAQPDDAAGRKPVADVTASGLMGELQQRLQQGSVTELRSAVNGEYGTTLLLANEQLVCYVGQLYQNKIWRVLRFTALAPAEAAYQKANKQAEAMAAEGIRRQVLTTLQRQYDRAIQDAQAQADVLQGDLRTMQAQRKRMVDDQKTSQNDAQAAEIQSRAARIQLDKLQGEIRRIESSLGDDSQLLPETQKRQR